MYKIMRYKMIGKDKTEEIHPWKPISESDLCFLMVNHGHTVYYEFLKSLRDNPFTWKDIYRWDQEIAVVLWDDK